MTLKEVRTELRLIKTHARNMQAHRAGANAITLGFLDALEEEHEREIHDLEKKIWILTPQKDGTLPVGAISHQDIARAKLVPINTFLKVSGSKKVNCLFHNDKVASMHVYPNNYYCFSCQASGTVIDIAMKLRGCSFVEAVKFLINK